MLVASITGKNLNEAQSQIAKATKLAEAIELRLDYLNNIDFSDLKKIRDNSTLPIIFTLRPPFQGGLFSQSEARRLTLIEQLIMLQPDYIDLEYTVPDDFLAKIHAQFPEVKIIRSYHHFTHTPDNLNEILKSMQHPACAVYKVVTTAKSTLDNFRLLNLLKENNHSISLAAHCMGELGIPSRILGKLYNNYFTYASLSDEQASAPGQLSLQELIKLYRYPQLNASTQICALLGDPVSKSRGHLFHNHAFDKNKINAVYVKLLLREIELHAFFKAIKKFPFRGFSVTMPLKESLFSYIDSLDEDAKKIGAINTLRVDDHKISATNTDAKGALDAIEAHTTVANKNFILLGAGGSAKAIAYEATKRGAIVRIYNRTASKAKAIAKEFNAQGFGLDELTTYQAKLDEKNIVVNTIPTFFYSDKLDTAPPGYYDTLFTPNSTVMDIIYQAQITPFIKAATQVKARIVPGSDMFENQARLQQLYWFVK